MKKLIAGVLGFEWIQNIVLKKVARVATTAAFALTAKSSIVAAVLAAAGVTSASAEAAVIVAAMAGLEAVRNWAKHSEAAK